jgi:ribosome-associated protein
MDDLAVKGYRIPSRELEWKFDPSGGPGGQHANRASSRVELTFDLASTEAFPAGLRARMVEQLGSRAPDGIVKVVVSESRSQWRNRQTARRRLSDLLQESMERPRTRRATRPSRRAREQRLRDKRRLGQKKARRRRPEIE